LAGALFTSSRWRLAEGEHTGDQAGPRPGQVMLGDQADPGTGR
jgi:hypothetical protein